MAQVRISHSLSDGEKKYLIGRKPIVQQCLAKNNIPCTLSKVPNIAILGSGGGERAMVGMLGSLYQMGEQGLLDVALYMIGVSGSTWCMASVYEKPNWSSDIKQIKSVVDRIGNDKVGKMDRLHHMHKYYRQNENLSLTDAFAALVVPGIVKNIDHSTLSEYQTYHAKDPYPIYTVIDQDCKYEHLLYESFFELTPHEAGYTLAGAFVETSSYGSIFNEGVLRTKKPEMDMTYLQGVCGSALADKEVILQKLKEWLGNGGNMKDVKDHKGFQLLDTILDLNLCQYTVRNDLENQTLSSQQRTYQNEQSHTTLESGVLVDLESAKILQKISEKRPKKAVEGASNSDNEHNGLKDLINEVKREAMALHPVRVNFPMKTGGESQSFEVWNDRIAEETVELPHDGPKLIIQMLELNDCILSGKDWTPLVDELNPLLTGRKNMSGKDLRIDKDEWVEAEPEKRKTFALGLTLDICDSFFSWFQDLKNATWDAIIGKTVNIVMGLLESDWIWGTNYNFLYNLDTPDVHQRLLKSETRHFEDAGLLVNSPYMSALRAEREIDLIISFDFSEGNPMETVVETAKHCKELGIPFPELSYTETDVTSPKAFYVFNGFKKAPTVIHMPLLNVENCGSELEQYREKYRTFQGDYSPEMIADLMKKAGENVINNKKNLLREIESIVPNQSYCWFF